MQHLHETGSMESLNCPIGNGRVIGEFTCDEILRVNVSGFWDDKGNQLDNRLSKTCLAPQELCDYLDEKTGYAWHISDLTIYEQPVELNEFWLGGKCPYASKEGCKYPYHCIRAGQSERCGETILRAPQSWCYTVAGNEPVGVGLNKTEEKGGQIPGHA